MLTLLAATPAGELLAFDYLAGSDNAKLLVIRRI